MTPVPNGYLNIRFFSRRSGVDHDCEFAIGWEKAAADLDDLEPVYDAYVTFGQAIGWTTSIAFTGIQVVEGTSSLSEPITHDFTGSDTGSGSSLLAPPMVTFLAAKRTLSGGRRGRGRSFIPHVQEAASNNAGEVDPTFRAGAQDALDDFFTAIGTWSGGGSRLLHQNGSTPSTITSVTFETHVATQRRRMVR